MTREEAIEIGLKIGHQFTSDEISLLLLQARIQENLGKAVTPLEEETHAKALQISEATTGLFKVIENVISNLNSVGRN